MTAYVNEEQKKEGAYGKAVKATLAATLAAGMVPAAAAFAQPAEEAAEGADVELLSADAKTAWESGAFTVENNDGEVVFDGMTKAEIAKEDVVEFTVDEKAHYLVPTIAAPMGGAAEETLADNDDYEVKYQTKAGVEVQADEIKTAGEYQVVVKAVAGDYQNATVTFDFKLVDATTDIKNAEFYQVAADAEDFSDKTVEYTGEDTFFFGNAAKGYLNIAVDGVALVKGTDYEVSIYNADDPSQTIPGIKDCGEYIAKFTGIGKYTGTFQVKFEVVALDLSKAEIELDTTNALKPAVKTINGSAKLANVVDVKVTAYPAIGDNTAKGEYTYVVSATDADKNIKGSQTIKHVVAANKATVNYGKEALAASYTVNHVNGDEDFDLSKIAVLDKEGKALDAKAYSVKVYDAEGNEVDASKVTEAGTWTVKVVVDAAATDYEYAGTFETVVDVTEGAIADGDVYFTFDGKVVKDNAKMTFDGTDALEKLGVKMYDADGKEIAASDYKVEVVNSEDEAVDSAVDADTYTVTVTSDKYDIANSKQTLVITVNPVEANEVRIDPAMFLFGESSSALVPYTGEAIELAFQYKTVDADGEEAWVALPADTYELTIIKDSKEIESVKDLGGYLVKVADNTDEANYEVSDADLYLTVSEEKVFSDVPNTEWFYEYVYKAQEAGYMFGIANSDVFAPNQATSRAMAVQVLARMASADGFEGILDAPFSDIDPLVWYADAVAWASQTGIVMGFPGTDEFRPEANVTRAQFCIMMKNYAEATKQGEPLAAGEADEILAAYEDGASVPEWCKEEVAWAVKNEIFGGYSVLNVDDDITRAEMAKMTVAFQPAALK